MLNVVSFSNKSPKIDKKNIFTVFTFMSDVKMIVDSFSLLIMVLIVTILLTLLVDKSSFSSVILFP